MKSSENKIKKVLLIADFDRYGGAKTYFWLLYDLLLKNSCQLKIIFLKPSVLTDQDLEKLYLPLVTYDFLPVFLNSRNKVLKRLRLDKVFHLLYVFWLSLFNFSKVIISTSSPYRFIAGAIFFGDRFYYILHSYPYFSHSRTYNFFAPLGKMINRLLFVGNATFITVSNESKKIFLEHLEVNDFKENFKVVHNPSLFKHGLNPSFDSEIVLTIGHLEDYKNPFFWLDVAIYVTEKNENACFYWVGDGTLQEQVQMAISPACQKRIKLLGYLENVSEILLKSWVYFQPSLVESHGISVVDAMAHSLPCVVSNMGGLPESVENRITGFVIDFDVAEAGEKILLLLADKNMAQKMGELGYEKFVREFSKPAWEENTKKIIFS